MKVPVRVALNLTGLTPAIVPWLFYWIVPSLDLFFPIVCSLLCATVGYLVADEYADRLGLP
jgi:hypothetical protein